MMAKRKLNKAAKIREVLDSKGWDTAPKDVIQTLAAKKIKVSSAQVSYLKAAHAKKSGKATGNGRLAKVADGQFSAEVLLRAKEVLDAAGSADTAVAALALVAKLR